MGGSHAAAAGAGAERRAEVGAMLVRGTFLIDRKNGGFAAAGEDVVTMFAVAAREAGEGEEVQTEYADEPFHVAKITEMRRNSCLDWRTKARRWRGVCRCC